MRRPVFEHFSMSISHKLCSSAFIKTFYHLNVASCFNMVRIIRTQLEKLLFFLALIKGSLSGWNNNPFQYQECQTGESLIHNTKFWASTYDGNNGAPNLARIFQPTGAWTALVQDLLQFLALDLGDERIISSIHTQGRHESDEYVTEFTLEFSSDNTTWEEYTNEFGLTMIFNGNKDGKNVVENSLIYPVIARYIKLRPLRWKQQISMRVDLIGCRFVSEPVQTSDDSFIVYDIADKDSNQTETDLLVLRFRTTQEDGILFYADGKGGDFILLELKHGQLHLKIDLGSTPAVPGLTQAVGGNILDDGRWHNVIYQRNRTNVILTVDRRETKFKTNGPFVKIQFGKIYLGGVDFFNKKGLSNSQNFNGCFDYVRFNGLDLIQNAKNNVAGYQTVGNVAFSCTLKTTMTYSLTTSDSFIRIPGAQQPNDDIKISFKFRTFDKNVNLLRHQALESSEVLVEIDGNGFVYYKITDQHNVIIEDTFRKIIYESETLAFTDGLWHIFDMHIESTRVNVTMDGNPRITIKSMDIKAGPQYTIGGNGIKQGFRGCLQNIKVGSVPLDPLLLPPENLHMVSIGHCDIKDKCLQNPCEHNGKCSQEGETFYCDCSSTGYTGAVCHTPAHPLSCAIYSMHRDMNNSVNAITIDPDGSGPIDPFPVTCKGQEAEDQSLVETRIAHNSMKLTTVDGFQAPDYYVRKVEYETDLAGLTAVVDRSDNCVQAVVWKCNNSRLMMRIDPEYDLYKTYGYWVGRTPQNMYYWGGSSPGTYTCGCGVTSAGCDFNSTTCNCDGSDVVGEEDGGLLTHKEFLPVLELHFGDTGTLTDNKMGQYKLGELRCYGDNLLNNMVTFRKTDATLEFPAIEGNVVVDVWFQFKTTADDGILLHDTGDDDDDTFVLIKLIDGNAIQFSYNVGKGVQTLIFKANYMILNDDAWHTIYVERNVKQALLRVDNEPEVIRSERRDQIARILDMTKPLTVGAAVDHRDGFVGCMRGLRVNGVLIDMRGAVRKGQFTYGVHEGCVGKCASNPCFNQGTCKEGYSHYTCDCAYTPFSGKMCSREVGVNMETNFMIRYEFDEVQGFSATDLMYIRVGFITKKKQGILIQLRNKYNTEYISLEMNNNGGVKFFLDVGFERWELNTDVNDIDLTNGQAHEVILRREQNGGLVYLQIDKYEAAIARLGEKISDIIIDNPKYLFIGNNDTENTGKGFEGCIYRMQIDNIYPLKRAFHDPRPSFIRPVPEGRIFKSTCGLEEITRAPDPVEERIYSPTCGIPTPAPTVDRGGKYINDGDLFFSFSRQGLVLDSNITGELTMSCRVTATDINVIYYILIKQETFRRSGEFECLAMIESRSAHHPTLYDQLVTDQSYTVNGTLDRAIVEHPYLNLGINVLNLTFNDAKDYVCEVAFKNSSTEVIEKASTVATINACAGCAAKAGEKPKEDDSGDDGSKTGVISGVTAGVIIIIIIIIIVVSCFAVRWKRKQILGDPSQAQEFSARYSQQKF